MMGPHSRLRTRARSGALNVKFILPALSEATDPYWRPIKYSLFPPLGLATLAAYLSEDDRAVIVDEYVESLTLDDTPDLVIIHVYITNAYRAYRIADHYRILGAFVGLGGLHATSLPEEGAPHCDALFLGPGEQTFPKFLLDFRAGNPQRVYASKSGARLIAFRRSAAISSGAITILYRIPLSLPADARSIATSATKTHSFRAGAASTRNG
jgi:radical SAM superfamily enzyme YgiQ (UPF0313 family)